MMSSLVVVIVVVVVVAAAIDTFRRNMLNFVYRFNEVLKTSGFSDSTDNEKI